MFITRDNRMSCERPEFIIYGQDEERMEKVNKPNFWITVFR